MYVCRLTKICNSVVVDSCLKSTKQTDHIFNIFKRQTFLDNIKNPYNMFVD